MPENDFLEKDAAWGGNKAIAKQINKFFSDYFKWLLVLEIILTLVLGYFLFLKPRYEQLRNVIKIINQQELADFENKKTELKKIEALLASYDSIDKKYIEKINSLAPVRRNKEELFSEISYLVSRNGLILQSVSLSEIRPYSPAISSESSSAAGNNLEEVVISFSMRGATYKSFKDFLSALENNLRLMDVISLNFDPAGGAINLTVKTYYSKE